MQDWSICQSFIFHSFQHLKSISTSILSARPKKQRLCYCICSSCFCTLCNSCANVALIIIQTNNIVVYHNCLDSSRKLVLLRKTSNDFSLFVYLHVSFKIHLTCFSVNDLFTNCGNVHEFFSIQHTAQKIKFSINDFFSQGNQIFRKLPNYLHLLK